MIKLILKKLFRIFIVKRHYIMRKDLYSITPLTNVSGIKLESVSSYNEIIDGLYSREKQIQLMIENKAYNNTFILRKNNENIGIVSVMFKKGNELEYRIRGIDAFIYNVFIGEKYRKKGYARLMLNLLFFYLIEKGLNDVYLAVSRDNYEAIELYKKLNFKIIKNKMFIRTLRCNLPYYDL